MPWPDRAPVVSPVGQWVVVPGYYAPVPTSPVDEAWAVSHGSVTTSGHWFGDPRRPLLGWLSAPAGALGSSGVLVLPDVGAQYWSSHRTLRVLAERLATAGHTVLRVDYDGTGDSAGDQWDPHRLDAWRSSAATGAAELRALGCCHLTVVGVRLGGMLALLDGGTLEADEVVAWAPSASGKRHARGLRLLGEPIPRDAGLTSGGVVFTPQTLGALSELDLARTLAAPAPRTLLLGEVAPKVVAHLEGLGGSVDHQDPGGSDVALDRSTEDAEAAEAVVDAICEWMAHPAAPAGGRAPRRSSAKVDWRGARLTEEVVVVAGLVGVLTEPSEPRPGASTLVLLNPGSGSHVGPGRAWVEYARFAAVAGHRALRVDWRGWGESPDDGYAPGRPYDEHTYAETVELVRALAADGHDRIVLSGLCASAWMALQVARVAPVVGVIAFNPQMYWQPGDPVLSQVDTGIERTPRRLREERGRRWGLWSALDVLGLRSRVGRWLDEFTAARLPVLVLFAEGDDGLDYLHNRLGRHLRRVLRQGVVRVEVVEGIDHGMHRAWLRPAVAEAVVAQLGRLG